MKEASKTSYYSVDDRLYQVVEDDETIRAFAVDKQGEYHQVGLARVYAEGTPMGPEEFNTIVAQRAAKRPIIKPNLRIVPKNG